MCTALVIGNMVGSGFFLAPSALAPFGGIAILGWIVTAAGSLCLALVFARLARRIPAAGGPYAYTRAGFGDFAGFLVAWGYWVSMWASLPSIALAFGGYLVNLFPGMIQGRLAAGAVLVGLLWLVAGVNLLGVKEAGLFQFVVTTAKMIPILALATIGLGWVHLENFSPLNPSGQSILATVAATAPITMFAFLGLESASVPAGDVKDPTKTIPRATLLGTTIAAAVYILGTITVMGVIPRESLASAKAPFAQAAGAMWGPWAQVAVGIGAMISSLGALNGWTLLMGQVPMAAARDGLMPAVFGKMSSRGVPAAGIAISMTLATILTLLLTSGAKNLVAFYQFVVVLSTVAALVPYVFCTMVEALIKLKDPSFRPRGFLVGPVAAVAFLYSLYAIYGAGAEPVLYGFLLLLAGLPVYVWMRREQRAAGHNSQQ
jgi:arginine:agmatine antiporter